MKIIRAVLLVMALTIPVLADEIPNGVRAADSTLNGVTAAGEMQNGVAAADEIPNGIDLLTLLTLILR